MSEVTEIFSSMVFDDATMEAVLPKQTYKALQGTIKDGDPLDPSVANVVAAAMKDWALQKGATHYTHWFQPMTGVTAEKHDSFISPKDGGKVIMEFSGKELVQGEPDASSFPNGGIRATFEARGYTAWDATSYAFIKEGVLCIPTVFCAYGGEALDQKTALLRSMEAINTQAQRILKLFGKEVGSIRTTVGPEQEYFLVDKDLYDQRKDLIYTGRTLLGAKAPKGQELDDHYFGVIKPRVLAYMKELNEELWKLGILAKTEHNEVAPSQHEMAPIFTTTNLATDHNQLTMELMKKVASRHNLVCLLHEKPFAGVNGSGKHNNWSISTDAGENLLEPGETPAENAQFLLFLSAVIKAVDEYQDLLRISIASSGNDHRLGANEAPPAIVSMFVGSDLEEVLKAIEYDQEVEQKNKKELKVGVDTLPKLPQDTTDRNRTSPFAFTGNKFEFRMLGSNSSISCTNTVLNTAVAEELKKFADELEKASDFEEALHALIKKTIKEHKRIIFNGDGYDDSWVEEATKRGLLNLKSTPDALAHLLDKKNITLFKNHRVYSEVELEARFEVLNEMYAKQINIEALTMLDMVKKDVLPVASAYSEELALAASNKIALCEEMDCTYEKETVKKLCDLISAAHKAVKKLEKDLHAAEDIEEIDKLAKYYQSTILADMNELRIAVDGMEVMVDASVWPYPSYGELLFGVR